MGKRVGVQQELDWFQESLVLEESREQRMVNEETDFDRIKDSLPDMCRRVLDAIPLTGITCKELSESWGCHPNDISGRFSDLEDLGLICRGERKELPNYRGQIRLHTVWYKI